MSSPFAPPHVDDRAPEVEGDLAEALRAELALADVPIFCVGMGSGLVGALCLGLVVLGLLGGPDAFVADGVGRMASNLFRGVTCLLAGLALISSMLAVRVDRSDRREQVARVVAFQSRVWQRLPLAVMAYLAILAALFSGITMFGTDGL
jgi:hypothetical protein